MKIVPYFICVFTIGMINCKTSTQKQLLVEKKDSLLQKYLGLIDSLPYYDSNSIDLQMLKAFSLNDTSTLEQLLERTRYLNTKLDWEKHLDSCVKQPSFEDIAAEEKYRFSYNQSFCPYVTTLTAIKQKDSMFLNTIVYQYAWDSVPCKIISQSIKPIDSLVWGEFQESLERADFWGLRSDNGRHGLDGSSLMAFGFKRSHYLQSAPDKSNFISRWSPASNAVFSCFILLLKYSKAKDGCITVR